MTRGVHIWALLAALVGQALALSKGAAMAGDMEQARLAGLYVKDGNQNGQLRFLASGLNTNGNGNGGLNAALNEYITNKQDMLEQLRPISTGADNGDDLLLDIDLDTGLDTGLGTGLDTGLDTAIDTGASANGAAANGAIYVSLGNNNAAPDTGTGIGAGAGAGSSPVNNLLPQVIGQALAQRTRVGGNRRRVQQRRRRVNKRGNVRRRRRGNKGKNGKKRPKVVIVRPNRG